MDTGSEERIACSYNRDVRMLAAMGLILYLAGCHHGVQDNDGVRQAIIDRLSRTGITVQNMDIKFDSIQVDGDKADAKVTFYLKGESQPAMPQTSYHLERADGKWAVVKSDGGGHGALPDQGAPSPHGAGGPPASGAMPPPDELPPAGKKK